MTKNIKETKKKIIEVLEGIKEFRVAYWEEVCYSRTFKAKSREEIEEKFNSGELEFENSDIIDGTIIDGSLVIDEVEND